MTVNCTFCNDTKQELGVPGACVWCDAPANPVAADVRRYTAVELRFVTNSAGDYVAAADYDALSAELTEQGLMVASESRRALAAERQLDHERELSEYRDKIIDRLKRKPEWARANDVEAASAIAHMLRLGYTYTGAGEWMKNLFDCNTCNDQGAVGNALNAEPCPDCTRTICVDPGKPGSDMTAKATFSQEGGRLKLESIEYHEPLCAFCFQHGCNGECHGDDMMGGD